MREVFHQSRRVYRYTIMKGVNNLIPAVAVTATFLFGPVAGIGVLACQFFTGALTDLSFFSALNGERPGD